MKAIMTQKMDTVWANACSVTVEAELDNAHTLTTRQLSSAMVLTLRLMCEEVRAESEREIEAIDRGVAGRGARSHSTSGREVSRLDEMERERDARGIGDG